MYFYWTLNTIYTHRNSNIINCYDVTHTQGAKLRDHENILHVHKHVNGRKWETETVKMERTSSTVGRRRHFHKTKMDIIHNNYSHIGCIFHRIYKSNWLFRWWFVYISSHYIVWTQIVDCTRYSARTLCVYNNYYYV